MLTYYNTQETKVEFTTLVETAHFLCQTYIRRLPLQINKSQLGESKYLGVACG